MAAFYAELDQSSSTSAIVFDDPVTSLDHLWRATVARRLADEAQRRQVVVFTHDAVFLTMLLEAGAAVGVAHASSHVQRHGKRPGHCSDSLPWDVMPVGKRIGALKDDHVALTKVRKAGTDEEYANAVKAYLDRLRKTWERAVEECLLNKVVERFGLGVATQRLKPIDYASGDYEAIYVGMTACSAWVHDPAQPLARPPPEPPELAGMVNDLVDWISVLRARRPNQKDLPKVDRIRTVGVSTTVSP